MNQQESDDRACEFFMMNLIGEESAPLPLDAIRRAFLAGIEHGRKTKPFAFPGSHHAAVWHFGTAAGKVLCDNRLQNEASSAFADHVNCPACLRMLAAREAKQPMNATLKDMLVGCGPEELAKVIAGMPDEWRDKFAESIEEHLCFSCRGWDCGGYCHDSFDE